MEISRVSVFASSFLIATSVWGSGGELVFPFKNVLNYQVHKTIRLAQGLCTFSLERESEFQAYWKSISEFHETAKVDFPQFNATTVLYPLSAYDSTLPVSLFPSADIVAVDDHRFLPTSYAELPEQVIAQSQAVATNWEEAHAVGRSVYLAHRIVAGIIQTGHQIESVTAFTVAGDYVDGELAVHGIIRFNKGPGTPTRQYIQLNGSFSSGLASAAPWWLSKLSAQWLPQAVIVKGSMYKMLTPGHSNRDVVIELLQKSRGILVEGAKQWEDNSWSGEFKGDSLAENWIVKQKAYPLAAGFGYGIAARVLEVAGSK